jgi:hypothetical protein
MGMRIVEPNKFSHDYIIQNYITSTLFYDLNRQKAHDFSRGMNAVIVIVPS